SFTPSVLAFCRVPPCSTLDASDDARLRFLAHERLQQTHVLFRPRSGFGLLRCCAASTSGRSFTLARARLEGTFADRIGWLVGTADGRRSDGLPQFADASRP